MRTAKRRFGLINISIVDICRVVVPKSTAQRAGDFVSRRVDCRPERVSTLAARRSGILDGVLIFLLFRISNGGAFGFQN
jgi:hypothetical protein